MYIRKSSIIGAAAVIIGAAALPITANAQSDDQDQSGSWEYVGEVDANDNPIAAARRSASVEPLSEPSFQVHGDKVIFFDPTQGWLRGGVTDDVDGITMNLDVPDYSVNGNGEATKQSKKLTEKKDLWILEHDNRRIAYRKQAKIDKKQNKADEKQDKADEKAEKKAIKKSSKFKAS